MSKTGLFFAGGTIAVLFSLMLLRFIAQPQWSFVALNFSRLKELKTAVSDTNALDSCKQRLRVKEDSLKSKYTMLFRQFGGTNDLPGVLRTLIEKANAADIQFVKMQPRPETSSDKTGSYSIVLEMTTSYHSLGRFISSLEAVPQMIHIDRCAVSAGRNATINIKIQVTCYLQKNGA